MVEQVLEVRCGACAAQRPRVRPPLVAVCLVKGSDVVVSGVARESRSAAQARAGGQRPRRSLLVPAEFDYGHPTAAWVVRCHRCAARLLIDRAEARVAALMDWFGDIVLEPTGQSHEDLLDRFGGAGSGMPVGEDAEQVAQSG